MRLLLTALCALFLAAASAGAATKPKPWQWTTATATKQVAKADPGIFGRGTLTVSRCVGKGKVVAKRYTSFQCAAVFKPRSFSDPTQRPVMFVKVRPVGKGQACISLTSLASVPAACLNPKGARSGNSDDATTKLREHLQIVYGTTYLYQGPTDCAAYGPGYFECFYGSNDREDPENGLATVLITTTTVRVTVTRQASG
jgi:hypothetical protein